MKLNKLRRLTETLGKVIDNWEKCQYMIEERDKDLVTFIPYDIKPIAKQLFSWADQVILMSATISNPKVYAKSLGIDAKDYGFLEVDSVFSPKKSPIMASSAYKLNYYNIDKDLPKVLELALAVCDKHKKDKGLIHTHSFKITQALQKVVRGDSRFLFREAGRTNEDILFEHKNTSGPTILVSPSMDTGISLDDDLGRFQIILKAPYLPLGSKRIKRILDEFPEHYSMKMLDTLIQMAGRCTRSVEDYSETYILDGVATNAVLKEKRNLPKSFLERFI
jgi:Rad3-related DNA helicase